MAIQRYREEAPCPICGGHEKMPQGHGVRCWGFLSDDGWAICTREESPLRKEEAQGWSHALTGKCPCGAQHGPDDPEWEAKRADARARAKKAEREAAETGGSVHSIGESKRAQVETRYRYEALDGSLLYEVERMIPKSFRQRRPHPQKPGEWIYWMTFGNDRKASETRRRSGIPEQKTTLYRIPELFAALDAGDTVYIVEGEKDVERIRDEGCVATCNTGGAGKFRPELAEPFRRAQPGAEIIVVQDRDEAGERHARQVFDEISARVDEDVHVRIVEPVSGKDAYDHLDAGHGIREFALVWPIHEDMLRTSPALYKRNVLRQAMVMSDGALHEASSGEVAENPPQFLSPLRGEKKAAKLQGVVTIAGAPSSGKSFFAVGCGIDNALDAVEPWDVFYLNCEMGADYVIDRALRAASSVNLTWHECRDERARQMAADWAKDTPMPGRFVRVDVGIGVTMEEVIEFLAENVTDTPTLVVLDSISSFVDNMEEIRGDNFGMSNLRTVQKYATAVRRLTKGHVSWLILSEMNAEGRAKGRSLDHRSDLAIAMKPDENEGHIKEIIVTKSWFSETGKLGRFALYPDIGRLVRIQE